MIAGMQGPSLFIAQYVDLDPALSSLEGIAAWAAGLGFRALQIPTFFPHILDLERAAADQAYCDEILALLARHGLSISELASPRQGQLIAVHPAYHRTNAVLAPKALRDAPEKLPAWAADQLALSIRAARRLGVDRVTTFSGSLLWPYLYPYPPVPQELIARGFAELARRWRPVLDLADRQGVDICFELHPTEDLHDGLDLRTLPCAAGQPPARLPAL